MNTIPFAVSVAEAVRLAGLGRTSLYAAISTGRLKTKKAGRRTLVETSALREFIANLPCGDGSSKTGEAA